MSTLSQSQQWSRLQKLLGTNLSRLSNASVAIVGLGSLGSNTATMLAMSGVSSFILVDPDMYESHNVVRHAADLRYVGWYKVDAVQDLIMKRNPDAKVITVKQNVMDSLEVIAPADLLVVAGLGSEVVTSALAERLRQMGKVTIFGGLYEKAIAGEVFSVHPKVGPCYSCFARVLRNVEPETGAEVNYGLPPDQVSAEPGLGIHVIRVAAVLSDWVVRILIHDPDVLPYFPGNLVILSNERYTLGRDADGALVEIPPSSSWWATIRQFSDCLVCSSVSFPSTKTIDDLLEG